MTPRIVTKPIPVTNDKSVVFSHPSNEGGHGTSRELTRSATKKVLELQQEVIQIN